MAVWKPSGVVTMQIIVSVVVVVVVVVDDVLLLRRWCFAYLASAHVFDEMFTCSPPPIFSSLSSVGTQAWELAADPRISVG